MAFNFLLAAINAKYIHSNLAIYSLRAHVGEGLRQSVELAEYTVNQPIQEILADIYRRKPDAVGFSCYIWNWRTVQELLAELPKLLPDTVLWLGGPEVSYDANVILKKYPQLTGIMTGEGEETFRELLQYYVSFGTGHKVPLPKDIRGLYLPEGCTPSRPLADPDSLPFPYGDLAPFENKIIYYESSRGCPFRCSYCLSSIDKTVRLRNIETVRKELQFFLDHHVKQVKFVDRTFNCDHDHAMAIWQYISKHDNGVTNFHFEISADLLRADEIELLKSFRPGLAQLEIGVQSVNKETLHAVRRMTNLEQLEKNVGAIRSVRNIHQHLDLIAGLPYENYDSFVESFNRVYAMDPDQLQLGFLKVLKGSEMWERAEEYGIRYLDGPPYEVLATKWLSYEEVLRLKNVEEMVELYYNSAQFTHTLPFLEKAFSSPFAMYEALADYYRQNSCLTVTSSRIYRYQVLLAFAAWQDGKRLEAYRELLTFDMYLREKPKTRPDFAAELSNHKDTVRAFYQAEAQNRRFLSDYAGYDWKQLSKMTHLEPFSYPVWDERQMAECYDKWGAVASRHKEPIARGLAFVLFDYKKRNPLNREAAVTKIDLE